MSGRTPSSSGTRAADVIVRCRELARITDVPGETTRTFLSYATKQSHVLLRGWMEQAGMSVRLDGVGNMRGVRTASDAEAPTLLLFSHIDTVPNAGPFDGPLGVLLALAVVEELRGATLPFAIEVVAFSEEEGVRFSFPFLSSLAATGALDESLLERKDAAGVNVREAIRAFGLPEQDLRSSCALPLRTFAALEVHIEQGPVLEAADASLAVVGNVVGQTRLLLDFAGQANHAGTTPMGLRRDALAAATEWIVGVELFALQHKQLVATVGRVDVQPGVGNVIAGHVRATLDVRHPSDASRHAAVATLLTMAEAAGTKREVTVRATTQMEQKAVALDRALTAMLGEAMQRAGAGSRSMVSGAGHDAMIVAAVLPTTMLFVRSPGGLSHHPEETVREQDVELAIATVLEFVRALVPVEVD